MKDLIKGFNMTYTAQEFQTEFQELEDKGTHLHAEELEAFKEKYGLKDGNTLKVITTNQHFLANLNYFTEVIESKIAS